MTTRNVAIMFTDIKGYTARVSEGTRSDLTNLRALHDRLLTPVFGHFEGQIVQTLGDAFLVYFYSPTDAVMCGIAIQEVLRKHNLRAGENERLEIRVAINSGDVEITDEGVMGEAVNLAARVESIAEAGEVWFTEAVYLAMNRTEAPSAEVGERTFKGIPYPVRVYRSNLKMNSELAQRMDDGVRITEKGPILRGLHRGGSAESKRPFWQLAGALSAGMALLLVGWALFSPGENESTGDKEVRTIRQALNDGDPLTALAVIDPLIRKNPGNKELRELAIDAADAHLARLRETAGAKQAMTWLENALATKGYLEPLRISRLPELDAAVSADFIRVNVDNYKKRGAAVDHLLERYSSARAPYLLARELEGVGAKISSSLYYKALKRGYEADEGIFHYVIGHLVRWSSTDWAIPYDLKIISEYYPARGQTWARKMLDESLDHNELQSAWRLLESSATPSDPYYKHIVEMAALLQGNGVRSDDVATVPRKAFAVFHEQVDHQRRQHILQLYRRMLEYPPNWAKSSDSEIIPRLEQDLKQLETAWES